MVETAHTVPDLPTCDPPPSQAIDPSGDIPAAVMLIPELNLNRREVAPWTSITLKPEVNVCEFLWMPMPIARRLSDENPAGY